MRKRFIWAILTVFAPSAWADDLGLPPVSFDLKIQELPDLKNKGELDRFIANVKSDAMPRILRMNECVQKTRIVAESYRAIKQLGYGRDRKGGVLVINANPNLPSDYPYDMNLLQNFKALEASQAAAMDQIEAFHRAMKLPDSPTIDDIKTRLTAIDAKVEALMLSVAESSAKEDGFLFLTKRAKDGLSKIMKDSLADITYVLSDSCKEVPVSPVAVYILADFNLMADGINEMQTVITHLRDRRGKMISYLLDYHKYKLTSAHDQKVEDSLTTLQDRILSVFAGARLVEEMGGWWQGVITRGLADRYHTYYCQYDEALRRLRATREKAQGYLDRVDTLKDAPESMKASIRQQANSMLGTIDRNINKLLKGGWQAQFNQQKLMVDSMFGIKDQYVLSCLPLLEDYRNYAETVKTNDDFHTAENKFAVLIDSCVAKGSN